jgi:hypothetical protein
MLACTVIQALPQQENGLGNKAVFLPAAGSRHARFVCMKKEPAGSLSPLNVISAVLLRAPRA